VWQLHHIPILFAAAGGGHLSPIGHNLEHLEVGVDAVDSVHELAIGACRCSQAPAMDTTICLSIAPGVCIVSDS
jgi:hypothetical protein